MAYSAVRKKGYFYLGALSILLNGLCLESITHTGVAHLEGVGINEQFVANVVTVASLVLTVSKVIIGVLYDKRGLRFTLLSCHLLIIVSFVLIIFANASPWGSAAGLGAMVLSRIAQPLETVMIPLICADLFGSKALLSVLGVFTAMKSIGSCIDAPLCNLVFDLTGTYIPVYVVFGLLTIGAAVLFQYVITLAYRDKKALTATK